MTGSAASPSRLDVIREKAARRGRIRHPEGDRYETPDWKDVTYLLDRIDALHAENRAMQMRQLAKRAEILMEEIEESRRLKEASDLGR